MLTSIVVSGMSALAGMAALAALLQVQPSLRQRLSAATSSPSVAAALGLIAGLCLAAPLVGSEAVYQLMSLSLGLSRRLPAGGGWFPSLSWFRFLSIFAVLVSPFVFFAVVFARAVVAVWVVSTVLSIDASGLCFLVPTVSFYPQGMLR